MTEFQSGKFLRKINVSHFNHLPRMSSFRTVRGLLGIESEVFTAVSIIGDSLKHLGIFGGDTLIVKVTKTFSEANLYIWDTPDGRTAKFAEMSCAEIAFHNGNGWRQTYLKADVSMFGVVVRIERDLRVKR